MNRARQGTVQAPPHPTPPACPPDEVLLDTFVLFATDETSHITGAGVVGDWSAVLHGSPVRPDRSPAERPRTQVNDDQG